MTEHPPPRDADADRPADRPGGPPAAFGAVADAYQRGRPTYPRAAATWLTGERPCTVLEVGAGTGKLTEVLLDLGHDVHATEPDEQMLKRLTKRLPEVRASAAGVEALPVPDRSVDVVVGAQCFHWFDLEVALPEIARVLRPGGHVAMVWTERDERIPWVRRLGRILRHSGAGGRPEWSELLAASGLFGFVDETRLPFWQTVDRHGLEDLVAVRSHVAGLGEAEREAMLAEALALYDGFGRGYDGMQLPWSAHCFRATVAARRTGTPARPPTGGATAPGDAPDAGGPDGVEEVDGGTVDPPTDDDTGTLLIDFR